MKTVMKIVLLTTMLGASGLALAGPEHRSHGANTDPANQPMREFASTLKRLDLSAEQQEAIEAIFAANKDAVRAQSEASRALREDIQELLYAPALDEEALAALAVAEGGLAEERVMLMGTLAADVLAQLDDEQRAELETLRAERLARRGEWRLQRSETRERRGS